MISAGSSAAGSSAAGLPLSLTVPASNAERKALLALGGEVICAPPCIFHYTLAILHTNQNERHENDFTAHG